MTKKKMIITAIMTTLLGVFLAAFGVYAAEVEREYEETQKWVAPDTWYGQGCQDINNGLVIIRNSSNDNIYDPYRWTEFEDMVEWVSPNNNYFLNPARVSWYLDRQVCHPDAEPEAGFIVVIEVGVHRVTLFKPVSEVYV